MPFPQSTKQTNFLIGLTSYFMSFPSALVERSTNVKSVKMEACGLASFKEISFNAAKPYSYFNASGKMHFVNCTQPLNVCMYMFIPPGAKLKK